MHVWEKVMKAVFRSLVMLVASAVLVTGCGHEGSSVAIIDLSAVAKATGQDEVIRIKAEATRRELVAQLQQLAQNLDQQLAAEAKKVGDAPTAEQEQRLQSLNVQARTQLQEVQQQAQLQANQIEQALVIEFKDSISPMAEEIAKAKGAQVILAQDVSLFWYEPTVDITDEVIAAWRAQSQDTGSDEVAQVEEELEAVEGELAEVEEQLEELQEVVEEGQSAPAE
jgi:Skp family chaperone for outer membrane proteins